MNAKIDLRRLYKVFGPDPESVMPLVRNGTSKQEIFEKHRHVVGLRDITLAVAEYKIQVIMGLSGSGKSTLVRHVNWLHQPTSGDVLIDGYNVRDLSPRGIRELRERQIGMVFQRFALFPHRTVLNNVAYGLSVQGVPTQARHENARKWIDRVGLSGYEEVHPDQLSGGMQQRVGLARALATEAGILLMDEPFSALDPLIRTDMQTLLLDLQSEFHKTSLFITHDLDEALRIGDQVAILRDGELIQNGTPQDIILRPANDHVREFTRDVNRGRVLRVGHLANGAGNDVDGVECARDMTIEEAMHMVVASPYEHAQVVDAKGIPLGSISLKDMVRTLRAEADPKSMNLTGR